jgi:Flp pilus assembly protein TadG
MAAITHRQSERGAELIEFALVFPLLLLVTLGMIDFGLLFHRYEVLTNASREGARVSVLPGYGSPDVIARVNQYLQATSLSSVSVSTVVGAAQTLDLGASCVTVIPVTVSYVHTYTFVGGIIQYFGGSLGSKTLTATSAMRLENTAAPCP